MRLTENHEFKLGKRCTLHLRLQDLESMEEQISTLARIRSAANCAEED
jgi:hypothetical protein